MIGLLETDGWNLGNIRGAIQRSNKGRIHLEGRRKGAGLPYHETPVHALGWLLTELLLDTTHIKTISGTEMGFYKIELLKLLGGYKFKVALYVVLIKRL